MIKAGIIGTGRAARIHAGAIAKQKDVSLQAIAGRDINKAREFIQSTGLKLKPVEAGALIQDKNIDALIIAVPPVAQTDYCISSFEADKHVLCEKPLAVDIRSCEKIVNAWHKSGRVGMVNFCYRLIPEIVEFRRIIDSGELGIIKKIQIDWMLGSRINQSLTWHWKGQKELGGGVLYNFGVHVLDYLLCNKDIDAINIKSVEKKIHNRFMNDNNGKKKEVSGEEEINIEAILNGNTDLAINLSLISNNPVGHRLKAEGSKGTIEVLNPNLVSHAGPFDFNHTGDHKYNNEITAEHINPEYEMENMFGRIHELFFNAIKYGNNDAHPDIKDGFRAIKLIKNIYAV